VIVGIVVLAPLLGLGMTSCASLTGEPMTSASARAGTSTPTPTPTMDPVVAAGLRTALADIRALPGVASASDDITLGYGPASESSGNDGDAGEGGGNTGAAGEGGGDAGGDAGAPSVQHAFHSSFTVAMTPAATAAQTARVAITLARHVGWTGVDLTVTTPATAGRIATVQGWSGTFDGNVDADNANGVASGLFTLASTPGVTLVSVGIPYTGRIDYGSLEVVVSPNDETDLARVRAVIDTTAFRDITVHGSFGNGAKP
jgi:hypothetical protein